MYLFCYWFLLANRRVKIEDNCSIIISALLEIFEAGAKKVGTDNDR